MTVPATINDLSTTASLNSPGGGENVFPDLDNFLRAYGAFIAQLRDGKLNLSGGTMTGTLICPQFQIDSQFYIYKTGGNNPNFVLDSGDVLAYDRTNNILSMLIGGTSYFTVTAAGGPMRSTAPTDPGSLIRLVDFNTGPGGGQHSHRNLLVNGNFAVNQRGYVSGTNTTVAYQYTLDMWRVVTGGQNVTFTNLGGGTANFANQVTAPAGGLEQVVPGESIQGGTYTLNWVGAGIATVNGVAVTKSVSFTLTAGTNAIVRFVGVVSYAQLEPGSAATTFEYLPYEVNLQRCERFYEIGEAVTNGNANAGQSVSHRIHFRARKYKTPTISYAITAFANAAVADARNPSADGLEWYVQATVSGGTASTGTWTASAEP